MQTAQVLLMFMSSDQACGHNTDQFSQLLYHLPASIGRPSVKVKTAGMYMTNVHAKRNIDEEERSLLHIQFLQSAGHVPIHL